jgi:hypothetical protein
MFRVIAFLLALTIGASAQVGQIPSWPPVQPAPSGGSFSLTYESDATSTSTTSPIIYGTATWGSGCNALIIPDQWYNTNQTDTITALTAGANSLAQVSGVYATAGANVINVDAWEVVSPAGTSGTVTTTYSANPAFSSAIAAYCLVSAHTTATATANSFGTSTVSQSITVPSGGRALIICGSSTGATITLTNGTADVVAVPGGTAMLFGHTTTTGTVSVTCAASGATLTLSLAAWGP